MFCQWCIESWSSVNSECPICRKNVVNKSYCLDLDYYIKNIIELGPIEMKNSYKLLAEKRNLEGPNGRVFIIITIVITNHSIYNSLGF